MWLALINTLSLRLYKILKGTNHQRYSSICAFFHCPLLLTPRPSKGHRLTPAFLTKPKTKQQVKETYTC